MIIQDMQQQGGDRSSGYMYTGYGRIWQAQQGGDRSSDRRDTMIDRRDIRRTSGFGTLLFDDQSIIRADEEDLPALSVHP